MKLTQEEITMLIFGLWRARKNGDYDAEDMNKADELREKLMKEFDRLSEEKEINA